MRQKIRKITGSLCWITYARSFLVTFGSIFVAFSVFVWFKTGEEFPVNTPFWVYIFVLAFLGLGLSLIGVGFLADKGRVEKWAEDASRGDFAVIFIMLAALPIYFLWTALKRKRRNG